ncbi:N-glycosylase/DNA lyase [Penicillium argentinense]|uniref:DNA-(apurinic or apyrimidinic site) lyase n=1 Tax=Penicillium argentinense TaxID=1131581 RepID=A0A9W9KAT9_9EURO|nr:N-glycosylase/DNA lyase [Penicillium argentinense]KAJ5099313.1 N-glycosylase/DNA lyase [Penicillium argentinense]
MWAVIQVRTYPFGRSAQLRKVRLGAPSPNLYNWKLTIGRWQSVPESEEWRCVLYGRLLCLKQDSEYLYYRTCSSPSPSTPPLSDLPSQEQVDTGGKKSIANSGKSQDDQILSIIKHYLNLSSNLSELYARWSAQDPNFKKKGAQFSGIRILRQDPWEALISFICSSNNNISRISQMVEKLCIHYGLFVAKIDDRSYHDFPTPEALAGKDVESNLRSLGFGYRAKYIYRTAVMVSQEREKGWLNSICNPESPAFGIGAKPGGAMAPEGRQGYREAHEKLLELQGVGPKVSDCVCLMGLGWGESVPVDTHVWQIAQRDYRFGKSSQKTLNKTTYDAVANHFRKLWGQEAGWAHSVLFTADLRSFADRLASTKKVDIAVKEEGAEVEIKTEVMTAVALTAPQEIADVKIEVSERKLVTKSPKGKKRKQSADGIIHASKSTETRRMSKRLRSDAK